MIRKLQSVVLTLTLLGAASANAEFIISSSTGLFTPSFRGEANTTYFGWSEGAFFTNPTPPAIRILDNPTPTLGSTALSGIQFYQNDRSAPSPIGIGSSTNNIHKGGQGAGSKGPVDLTLSAPTAGSVGLGFTTIIVQGMSLSSGTFGQAEAFLINQPSFQPILTSDPDYVMGINSGNRAQFWVKYEIPGNVSVYDIAINLPTTQNQAPISIANLTVDTYWNTASYAVDTAAVPEPSTWMFLGLGATGAVIFGFRRKKSLARLS